MLVNAKEDGYTCNQVLWRQRQGGLVWISRSFYATWYFHLFTSIYYVKIDPKMLDLVWSNVSFGLCFSRVNRNKWANFVGCWIDQTFWREARVHVVSFGDQDAEARFFQLLRFTFTHLEMFHRMLWLFTEAIALQEVLQEIHRLQWGLLVEK